MHLHVIQICVTRSSPPPVVDIYLNTTSLVLNATSTANYATYACMSVIWVNVTGNFYTNRFYSCLLTLDNGHQVASAPALAASSALVTCPFNTSEVIYQKTKDGFVQSNGFSMTLLESVSAATQGSPVANFGVRAFPRHKALVLVLYAHL